MHIIMRYWLVKGLTSKHPDKFNDIIAILLHGEPSTSKVFSTSFPGFTLVLRPSATKNKVALV